MLWEKQHPSGDLVPKTLYRSGRAPLPSKERIIARKDSLFQTALECDYVVKGRETLGTKHRHYTESMKLGQGVITIVVFEPYAELLAVRTAKSAQTSLFRS